jgi:SAM-dependent methyltransferase
MSIARTAHEAVYNKFLFSNRSEKLTQALDSLIPASASILDVGCGNGVISWNLGQLRSGRQFTGVDVVERDTCLIPCQMYDGDVIPFAPASFDYVLFVDVLHHTTNAERLLAQAKRIARKGIVIKDHYCESRLDHYTLAFMDRIGNPQHGIPLPNSYKSSREWRELFGRLGVHEIRTLTDIGLYPVPFNLIFGRGLHFVSILEAS